MLHRILLVAAVLCMFYSSATAQQTLYSYQSTGTLNDFMVATMGDSILLSFEEKVPGTRTKKSLWVSDLEHRQADISFNVMNFSRSANAIYAYDLVQKSSSRTLLVYTLPDSSRTWSPSPTAIRVHGMFLGSYVDRNLFLFMIDQTGQRLTRLEFDGTVQAGEKTFELPINILPLLDIAPIEIYSGAPFAQSLMGRAPVKIYNYDSLYMTVDQGSSSHLMTLDVTSGKVTRTRFAVEKSSAPSSFLFDGKLFQLSISKKKFGANIIDASTHESIAKSEILSTHPDFPVYFHYQRKNVISHRENFSHMLKTSLACMPMAIVQKKEGQYIMQCGSYYDSNGFMAPGPTPAGIIKMVVGTAILQAREGPGVSRYFYYAWNPETNKFTIDDPLLKTVHQKIDDYEIAEKVRFDFKAYLPHADGVAAVYYNAKTRAVSVVYFD